MIIAKLVRWSGVATLIAGLLLIAAEILFIVVPETGESTMLLPGRIFAVLCMAGAVPLTLGLTGIYLYQAEQAGPFGLVAFLVALTGSALMIASDWNELFAGPTLVQIPGFEESFPAMLVAGFILNVGLYVLGWLLFGIASFQARVFPRSLAVLLAIGAPALLIGMPGSILPLYIAFAWMGLVVVRGRATMSELLSANT